MNDYERTALMGDGAQGKVFRVRHRRTMKEYAMKVMQCADQEQLNSALKEIKVLIDMRHPHIVSYTDFFLELGDQQIRTKIPGTVKPDINVCLVMELCERGDMSEQIKEAKRTFIVKGKNPHQEASVRKWMRQCGLALQFIHEKGFLHRDLKPTNVFFCGNDDIKLGDFGLATTVGCGRQSAVGTPCYFAPELMLRQLYDGKVDIWGLGVVFLELLTLRERPINSEVLSQPSIVDCVIFDIVDMGYSENLATLVRDMLRRYPDDRPSPTEMLQRLHLDPVQQSVTLGDIGVSRICPDNDDDDVPRGRVSRVKMCEMCQESPGVIHCPTCEEFFCRSCDASHHRVNDRRSHRRYPATPSDKGHDKRALKCEMCEAFAAVVQCPLCNNECYCRACDEVKHKNSRRQTHVRAPVDALQLGASLFSANQEQQEAPVADLFALPQRFRQDDLALRAVRSGNVHATRRPFVAQAANAAETALQSTTAPSICRRGVASRVILHVPGQHHSIVDAVAAAPQNARIIVAGGGVYVSELRLTDKILEIIGENPKPRIEICGTVAVHIGGGNGVIQNFEIVQQKPPARVKDAKPFGIEIVGGQWTISDCVIRSQSGSCIGISGDADPIIRKCCIREGRQGGVFVFDGGKGLLQENQFLNCGYAAILLKRKANPKIIGNSISEGDETGIFCRDSFGVIEGNIITQNRGCGIVVKGQAQPAISQNRISHNSQAGVFCCDHACGTVSDNEIFSNTKAGMLIKTEANPMVVRNKICYGKETGIYVFERGQGVIEDNDIAHNTNAGILVTTGGHPTVQKNRITRNMYEGVWVCKSGRGKFLENDLRWNSKGAKDIDATSTVEWDCCTNMEA